MDRAARVLGWLRERWALALPAVALLGLFPYLPAVRSPNELCRLYQSRALVDHGQIEINRVLGELGGVGDLSCVAVARSPDGRVDARRPCPAVKSDPRFGEWHYFPSKAPLLSVAATVPYALLKAFSPGGSVPEVPLVYFARLFCTVFPALLILVPLRRFLSALLRPETADALTAAYALGTLAFSYAHLFMSHQTTAVLGFACFYALWRLKRGEWPRSGYALAGLFAGLVVACEYTGALLLLPLAAYGLWTAPGEIREKARAAGLALAGALPVVAALALYHWAAFGHPLDSGYKYLNDAAYQGWHLGGFLGIRFPDPRALAASLVSPLRGLFTLSPFLALALPGMRRFYWTDRVKPELALSVAVLALYAYFTSSFSYDSWGWTTGPRHLAPLVPFLLIPVGLWFDDQLPGGYERGVGAGLAAYALFATGLMTLLNYIPDSLTNALWDVALPLAVRGYLPHSPLSLLGVPNPWAALPALLAMLACALLVIRALLGAYASTKTFAAAAAALLLVAGLHLAARPRTDRDLAQDRRTLLFLEESYAPRPGQASFP